MYKEFTYNGSTYGIKDGFLYKKYANIWGYTITNDEALLAKATANGYKGEIKDNLIDNGFHSYRGKQKTV